MQIPKTARDRAAILTGHRRALLLLLILSTVLAKAEPSVDDVDAADDDHHLDSQTFLTLNSPTQFRQASCRLRLPIGVVTRREQNRRRPTAASGQMGSIKWRSVSQSVIQPE